MFNLELSKLLFTILKILLGLLHALLGILKFKASLGESIGQLLLYTFAFFYLIVQGTGLFLKGFQIGNTVLVATFHVTDLLL